MPRHRVCRDNELNQFGRVKRSLPNITPSATTTVQSRTARLAVSLVLTRLDYCNAVLAGQLNRPQSVINAAARPVLSGRRTDHITPLLMGLHWLRVSERIEFKLRQWYSTSVSR